MKERNLDIPLYYSTFFKKQVKRKQMNLTFSTRRHQNRLYKWKNSKHEILDEADYL